MNSDIFYCKQKNKKISQMFLFILAIKIDGFDVHKARYFIIGLE